VIRFDVLGTPAPKGSNRAMLRGGRAVFVPGGSKVNAEKQRGFSAAIREKIAENASQWGLAQGPAFVRTALSVHIVFRLARPGGHWGSGKNAGRLKPGAPLAPATVPDVDKLARHAIDVLTGSIFDDDSRIVELRVLKEYALPGCEGATITVDEWRAA
jgi:Holliday junction resolvase RusA-like endonuclease